MKRKLFLMLFLYIGIYNAISQNDYVKVDQSKVDEVIKSIIKDNAGASPENKAWAEQLLKNAFGSYFSGNVAKVDELLTIESIDKIIQEKKNMISDLEEEKNSLNGKISKLEKEKISLNGKISDLEKEKIFLNGRISQLESEKTSLNGRILDLEKDKISLNGRISQLESEKTSLNGRILDLEKLESGYHTLERLRDTLYSQNKKMKGENEKLKEAQKDYEKLGSKKDFLEQNIINLCDEYNYIGGVGISDIEEKVKEYNSFIAFYSSESNKDYKKPEIKEKLEYLDALVKAENFYQRATESMSEKYDEVINSKLIENYKASVSEFDKLNDNQKDKLKSVYDALCGLPEAMKHFREEVYGELLQLELIPNASIAERNREALSKRVEKYCGKKEYNVYYVNLNKVLNDKTLGKLTQQIKKGEQYEKFLKDIEESL